jgi:WD40 repeat protein
LIAFGSEIGQLGIYDLRILNQKPFSLIQAHDSLIKRVEFNPKRNQIATGSEDCRTRVFSVIYASVTHESGMEKIYESLNYHQDYVTGLAWNPLIEDEYVSGSWDGRLVLHHLNSKSDKIIEKAKANGL